jgi:exopolysaccharide biosynthesis polyprenyl glycosylphosphotransferase
MLKYDAILINDLPAEQEKTMLKLCFAMNKRVYYVPKISDILVKSSGELNQFDSPLYYRRNMPMNSWERMWKRFFDLLFSALALLLLSPLLGVVALAIKLEDGGSVFFRQERCTIGGEIFSILKFRSMIEDADKAGEVHPAEDEDPRITKVGRFIRKFRIDELPQLINILKGDMSIVGPRPERLEHIEMYTKQIPEFCFREKVKGGLTGYAQVYGKYNTSALDKLKMDLIYIVNYSILLDIQIIFETVRVLFSKESTEGFGEEQTWYGEEQGKEGQIYEKTRQ